MAISNVAAKIFLLMILIEMMTSCSPEKCLFTDNQFEIRNWNGAVPTHGILYRYRKWSNFSILEQKSEADFKAKIFRPDPRHPADLIVNFTGYQHLSTESDYKLVLDNKIEYRIHDLKSGDFVHGCNLDSGKVNRCDLPFASGFLIPNGCGEPVNSALQ